MAWKDNGTVIEEWGKLQRLLIKIGSSDYVACRGQPAEFRRGKLWPSFDRAFTKDVPYRRRKYIEEIIEKRFFQHAPNHLPIAQLQHLDCRETRWMLMRHYGTPTRLLDWTESVWIGAYFAAFEEWGKHGLMWVFDRLEFDRSVGERSKDDKNSDRFWRLIPRGPRIPRMIAQQGFFTVAERLGVDHAKAIDERILDRTGTPQKQIIRIAGKLKPQILKELDRMGINGATLFPGIEGVGYSLTSFAHYAPIDKSVLATEPGASDERKRVSSRLG